MNENLTIAIILSICALVFGWSVSVIAVNIRRSRTSLHVTELHSRLLNRFAGNQELIAFLEGESGRRYFEALESDLKDPFNRVLTGIQLGVVLVLVGFSLVGVRGIQRDMEVGDALLTIGIPVIAVGLGFLISAAISYRLSKSWGLVDQNRRQRP